MVVTGRHRFLYDMCNWSWIDDFYFCIRQFFVDMVVNESTDRLIIRNRRRPWAGVNGRATPEELVSALLAFWGLGIL